VREGGRNTARETGWQCAGCDEMCTVRDIRLRIRKWARILGRMEDFRTYEINDIVYA